MALAMQGLQDNYAINKRNNNRYMNVMEGKDPATAPVPQDDAMRVDSDDVAYNYYMTTSMPSSNPAPATSPLMGLAKTALIASGIGIPAVVGLAMAPSIIDALNGTTPAAVAPADPKTDAPTLNIGGIEYELSLEPDTE